MAVTGRFVALLAVAIVPTVLLGSGWGGLAWIGLVVLAAAVDLVLAADLRLVRVERRMPRLARRDTTAEGTLVLANDGRRVLRAVVRDMWEPSAGHGPRRIPMTVPGGERRTARMRFAPFRRGRRTTAGIALRAAGPLGLAARQRVVAAPDALVVTPPFRSRRHLPSRLARLRELDGETTLQLRGHGTEFDSLRDYVRGDDVRSIDWRATARRQDLVVRTWRPERDRRVVVVVDAGRAGAGRVDDEPRLDTAIETALLVGALAAAAGDRVDLVVLDDTVRGRVHGATRADVVQRFGETLATAEPGLRATDWAAVPAIVDAVTTQRALVVLATSLDSVGASGDLLAVLPVLGRRHAVVVTSVEDPAVVRMAATGGTTDGGGADAAGRRAGRDRTGRDGTGRAARDRAGDGAPTGRRTGSSHRLGSSRLDGWSVRDGWSVLDGRSVRDGWSRKDAEQVYRRAAAERTLRDADGVADVARRAGAEVVRGLPEDVPPRTADAYIRAKASGRL
ncbi:DUF58 domain-containing protein [Curtobacterium sp. MCPF17_050]|uniref:DUF58 domain-containing protein n=1 Tax=Curtobacterium sp. MCPF17_050 TaxID=2175664 RepID=UPI0021AD1A09|nr:DUF58 domain-containing protein [Curtobacterium sp. MCPF17_050]WIB14497.1 DUF58 domain-containing protein [Curtobacterium sp. MCPF17_050]